MEIQIAPRNCTATLAHFPGYGTYSVFRPRQETALCGGRNLVLFLVAEHLSPCCLHTAISVMETSNLTHGDTVSSNNWVHTSHLINHVYYGQAHPADL
jgi:hypothetical protein